MVTKLPNLLFSDIAQTLLPGLTTYTPEQVYQCHVFLTQHSNFFDHTPRGFRCVHAEDSLLRIERDIVLEEERRAQQIFTAKMRYKLNTLRAQRQQEASEDRVKVSAGKGAPPAIYFPPSPC